MNGDLAPLEQRKMAPRTGPTMLAVSNTKEKVETLTIVDSGFPEGHDCEAGANDAGERCELLLVIHLREM